MPVTWEFRGAALVVTTAGKYQEQELTQAVAEARADPRFRPGTFLLFDGSLSEAELTTESVQWRVAWNLTVGGLDWSLMVPDVPVEAGEVVLPLTKFAAPCANIAGFFRDGDYSRVSQKLHPGWARICARVTRAGVVRVGDTIRLPDRLRRA